MKRAQMQVKLIARTEFHPPAGVPWAPESYDGPDLVEFAGRACYQSWNRPNPATATNAGYIRHLLEVGHLSVLEHASVTFYVTGVSRSLTHELVRHRHLSYSQLSQRYVSEDNAEMVVPQAVLDQAEKHPELLDLFRVMTGVLQETYGNLRGVLEQVYSNVPDRTLRRKLARQAARAVLPNATETKIVVTGNYRAWRHFITMRATEHADVEIRALAVAILRQLWEVAPAVFCDFIITELEDGTEVASSPYVHQD